ncbi:GDP-mannose 4,6-dehydratase [Paenibacillus sp. JZ16]|uniref:GDP-mannose 4,6-dehydratase n=1 Tax=Paenibacillus sp. JZ16 TaxID=1906272 RepID=UPI00188C7705|nr:GDP-mannose 4,6-dehydratase [Paenibacillus sp. JZ16]
MKALITGVNGFVGRHLEDYLLSQQIEVWGTSRSVNHEQDHLNRVQLDFNQEEAIVQLLNTIKPDLIFHLAAQSSVAKSWVQVSRTLDANVTNTALFYDAIKQSEISDTVKILSIGSSEEYGIVSKENIPISETDSLNPTNPYGISKVTQYMLAKFYSSLGLHIVHVRPFNHIGPGQKLGFVASDFSYQIAKIELGLIDPVIKVGNLSAKRDFLDVRDIVRAYGQIIMEGVSGEVYNICSGEPIEISTILSTLVSLSKLRIEVITDQSLLRDVDIPLYVGSNRKIKNIIDWKQEIPIDRTLLEVLNFWRGKIQIVE